ncbi:C-C motif chemokine 27a [Stigmatopora argus]
MDLKAAVVTFCLVALVINSTEGGISKCCINTRKTVPKQVLAKVQRWYMQYSSGLCDIDALVLYVGVWKKPICVHTNMENELRRVLKMRQIRLGTTH